MPSFRRALARTSAASLVLVAAACADGTGPGSAPEKITALPRALSADEQVVISASNAFGFALLQSLNEGESAGKNIFMSPLSASMALGMTMNGAAGPTYDEMRTTLGFPDVPIQRIDESYASVISLLRGLDPKVDFRIANSIWYRAGYPFHQSFFDVTKEHFDARVEGLDFAAPQSLATINGWVDEATNGKIKKMLSALNPGDVMVLLNAIYFKGDWTQQFDKSKTAPATFTTASGERQQVPFMHMGKEAKLRVGTFASLMAIELPYAGDAYAMTIVMPPPGGSIDDVVSTMSAERWAALTSTMEEMSTMVSLPKFTLEWEARLNEPLKTLGMPTAFVGGLADFTGMSPNGRDLYISEVKQKSFVDVHEEGTEAAAATSVVIRETSAPVEYVIDRPFMFAIRERLSGTVLFIGKMVRIPTE